MIRGAAAVAVACALIAPGSASAAALYAAGTLDDDQSDGVCDASSCTLRDAIAASVDGDTVMLLPGVSECAVVGVPDEKTGEAVKLVIVKKDPSLTEEKVREYCQANLTGYKRPKIVEFRTELPKTPVGKILRRALRDEVVKKAAA